MANNLHRDKKYLQYAFFIDQNDCLFSCDENGEEFLHSIDINAFYTHLKCIQLNTACTASTIILNDTSYSLRLIPVSSLSRNADHHILERMKEGYIIILQNQSFFSFIIQKLNKIEFHQEQYSEVLEKYFDGIFVTKADGTALFSNSHYEDITQITLKTIAGNSVYDMESEGLFTPLVTPTVLETKKDYTVFQLFQSGKHAVITGSPIYDMFGSTILILICVTPLTNPQLMKISEGFFESSKKPKKKLNQNMQIDVIAESDEMRQVVQDILKVAHYDVPIMLLGESGTGKEVFSSIIHASSKRRYDPFIKVNCSAIAPTLLDAELFGYEPGAFTGASPKGKAGLFETADNGTLLLDEIGDMPLDIQAKILRVVQDGEIYRVGGWTPIKVNTRIIAATNKNLKAMVSEGKFRNDLYYRLNVMSVHLPPLRKRRQDIAPLLQHYCYIFNKKYSSNKVLSQELIDVLSEYSWPGNVRELRNLIERMFILCMEDTFKPDHFYKTYLKGEQSDSDFDSYEDGISVKGIPPLNNSIKTLEKIIVTKALEKTGNTRKAAQLLDVSQTTIMRKMKEYNISNIK
jgi:transcriptional regulator with PAS, ATPase and Fis domain